MFSMLNMHSASDADDLTRRARVRQAALELFAEHGFEKTTVQAIADAAGVSPALVIHHYGSKDELRRHCDEHVVEKLINEPKTSAETLSASAVMRLLGQVDSAVPAFNYLARMLVEPGEAGDELFARLVTSTEQTLAEGRQVGSINTTSDPQATALVVTMLGLAQFLMRDRFTQVLGVDPFSVEGAERLTVPTLELLTNGLYADHSLLEAARNALQQKDSSSTEG